MSGMGSPFGGAMGAMSSAMGKAINPNWISGGSGMLAGMTQNLAESGARQAHNADVQAQIDLQREFAQNGIRWRVEDAQAAGISPLAALGAPGASFSPISVGGVDTQSDIGYNMGADISRAMMAQATPEERQMQQMKIQGMELSLEGQAIENQIKISQLQKMNAVGPALPSAAGGSLPGQGTGFLVKPAEVTAADRSDLSREAGAVSDYGLGLTSQGGYVPVPSKDMKERIEDNAVQEALWAIRNNLLPNYGFTHKGAPEGTKWNVLKQQYDKSGSPSTVWEMAPHYQFGKWLYKKWKGGK